MFSGRVAQARFRGDHVTLAVEVAAITLEVTLPPSVGVAAGDHVEPFVAPDACLVVPAEVDAEVWDPDEGGGAADRRPIS